MTVKQYSQGLQSLLLAVDDKNSLLCEISAQQRQNYAYTAYGDRPNESSSSQLGYNGELREDKWGWYLLGNGYRACNPRLMRFHSPDSLSPFGEGGLNAYAYCGGNPVMRTDPTGRMGKWVKLATGQWSETVMSSVNSGPLMPSSHLAQVPVVARVELPTSFSGSASQLQSHRNVTAGVMQDSVVQQPSGSHVLVTTPSNARSRLQQGDAVSGQARSATTVSFSEMAERVHFDSSKKLNKSWVGVDEVPADATFDYKRRGGLMCRPKQLAEVKSSFIRQGIKEAKVTALS